MRRGRVIVRAAVALMLGALGPTGRPVAAEMRFGPGMRVGGHDVSHRRYGGVPIARAAPARPARLPPPARRILQARRRDRGARHHGGGTLIVRPR
ncbi:hypothetical protein FOHLNKBM_0094 [Methylobacterium longum]|nr:hypothetical protein FOHLNKBM_0094 [Methylobacterium longum]